LSDSEKIIPDRNPSLSANNTIIKIESWATYNPRVETLKQIANALGVGIDDLMK